MTKRRDTSAQPFGGQWSVHKVLTVAAYLQAYRTALKHQPFKQVYIDAFAGSGSFSFESGVNSPLFDERRMSVEHAGSAARALQVDPPFDQLFFVESSAFNLEALKTLIGSADPGKRARVLEGDANHHVKELCSSLPWTRTRGVIFLDPFGNSVEWPTLSAISGTRALDVWYLFPLAGIFRNAPIAIDSLSAEKRGAITRVLGTHEWMDHFYAERSDTDDLFEPSGPRPKVRSINVRGIEAFVHARLATVFPHVAKPVTILRTNNVPAFSLFFAISNPNQNAWAIASRIAKSLLKPKGRGIHPTFGH